MIDALWIGGVILAAIFHGAYKVVMFIVGLCRDAWRAYTSTPQYQTKAAVRQLHTYKKQAMAEVMRFTA